MLIHSFIYSFNIFLLINNYRVPKWCISEKYKIIYFFYEVKDYTYIQGRSQ